MTVCYGLAPMNAITLLRGTGMTTAEIAKAIGCSSHAIRFYERGQRFPTGEKYRGLVELARSRGLQLTASDFETSKLRGNSKG